MEKMEIMVPGENRTEAERMLALLAGMSEGEQREMLTFMKGVEFGRQMAACRSSGSRSGKPTGIASWQKNTWQSPT